MEIDSDGLNEIGILRQVYSIMARHRYFQLCVWSITFPTFIRLFLNPPAHQYYVFRKILCNHYTLSVTLELATLRPLIKSQFKFAQVYSYDKLNILLPA